MPMAKPLKLFITRDDRQIFWIECYVDGEVYWSTEGRVGPAQKITVPLVAPNPFWGTGSQVTTSLTMTNGTTDLTVSMAGQTAEDWPVLLVRGPVDSGAVITSDMSPDTIEFVEALGDNKRIAIDLRMGRKIVVDHDGAIMEDSHMTIVQPPSFPAFQSFFIPTAEDVFLALGGTSFKYHINASGTGANSRFELWYYRRFLSL